MSADTPLNDFAAKPILIIGAGQAGATAAATLRQLGHTGGIVMLGSEAHAPYERPPLSKSVLSGEQADHEIGVHPTAFYDENTIDLHLGRTIASLDVAASVAHDSAGDAIPYSHCLIATGGTARELPELPAGTPGVHYIRSLDDARGLRAALAALPAGETVLVIGGGFLGLETASTALTLGRRVVLVEAGSRLLERAVPPALSEWLSARARHAGVDLRLGRRIAKLTHTPDGTSLMLDDGAEVSASLTVVAIGLVPDTALADAAGIAVHPTNRGVRIDAQCRTNIANVFAAGDCASQFQPLFRQEMRMESWQSANEQARLAAAAMLGVDTAPQAVPWFWTDQFGCNFQMLGAYDPALDYIMRGNADPDAAAPKFLLLGLEQGHLRHGIAVNAGGDLRQLRVLIEKDLPCAPAALQDTTLNLRQLVRDAVAASPAAPLP